MARACTGGPRDLARTVKFADDAREIPRFAWGSLAALGISARGSNAAPSPQAPLGMTPTPLAYFFKSLRISRAAFAPDPPVNPAPGCVPLPHKYKFWIGVR